MAPIRLLGKDLEQYNQGRKKPAVRKPWPQNPGPDAQRGALLAF